MQKYLDSSEQIDWQHPSILDAAKKLSIDLSRPKDIAESCFIWVRDNIRHTGDHNDNIITCRASDVLQERTGYCFSKSHLLTALLRANDIPAGLCYQRLSRDDNGPPFCLHGLTAIHLPDFGWYRVDPRGNKPGVKTDFMPPTENLAFELNIPGEADLPEIWADPLPIVIDSLLNSRSPQEAWANLPDIELIKE